MPDVVQDLLDDAAALLPLALSRPPEALARARAVLAARPSALAASLAHQAAGIVLRDRGDADEAIAELRAALRKARSTGSVSREADVLATLGVTLTYAGRTAAGRAALDTAVRRAEPEQLGQTLMRRGGTLSILGRHRDALDDLDRAVAQLAAAGDTLWEPRALTGRAFSHLALGDTDSARHDLLRAEQMLRGSGQDFESAAAVQNLGVVALRAGDLPAALSCFAEAAERFAAIDVVMVDLSTDRCAALLAAGLPRDALAEVTATLATMRENGGVTGRRAEVLVTAAACALAADEAQTAAHHAAQAVRLFTAQDRPWWRAEARLVGLRARLVGEMASSALLRDARRWLADAEASGHDRTEGLLFAGQVALALGRPDSAVPHLRAAARARLRGPALSRVAGWLAQALCAEVTGDARGLLRACRRGLDAVDEHRSVLGSSWLRAHATTHGTQLAELAQRCVLRRRSARELLTWSDRWRATSLAAPPVRPPRDEVVQAELTAVREAAARLDTARAAGLATAPLEREQAHLEHAVAAHLMQARGDGGPGPGVVAVPELLAELGDDVLLQVVDLDGTLHVLVCGSGRVVRVAAGGSALAVRELEFLRFGLSRIAHTTDREAGAVQMARLDAVAARLGALLIGPAHRRLPDGAAVVVAPPARWQAVPWAALPELHDRAVTVAPSAGSWLAARRARRDQSGRVVLVQGPGLGGRDSEIRTLARRYPDAVVLGGGTATAARVLAAMDGAGLVHLIAHGRFRADNPLFSAVELDDGPLTVHDLERLERAPRLLVLASCDVGLHAPVGADEMLGLAASLLPLGTTGVVASVLPVNDDATIQVMTMLHRELGAGAGPAEALRRVRAGTAGNALLRAAGCSFVALGSG